MSITLGYIRRWCWALLLVLLPAWAVAQNTVTAVTGSQQGGSEAVRIDLSNALATLPSGFTLQSPARIALDFPGVANGLGRSTIDINQGNVRSATVVQAGDKTRVVLNLKQPTTYTAEWRGNSLYVLLERVVSDAVTPTNNPFAVTPSPIGDQVQALKDVDFRRGAEGAGKVVVVLPNSQVGVDVRPQGQNLVVEFQRSSLPEGLRRRLDVSDFGTPVQTVSVFPVGNKVRMVIEPKGAWEHSAYQTDNQFHVEVRPQKIDPDKLTKGVGYTGEKLSFNFQNGDVRQLLQVIADFTNFNIIASDAVTGPLTLRLKDVPWDQALDIIMQVKGLGMKRSDNVIWVAPKEELAAREKQELESRAAIENLEPLRTQSFQLNYTKAAAIATQIAPLSGIGASNASARLLSSRGSVITEPRTNQLFVTDVASRLAQVQAMINKLDVPVSQVLIEARIVEASDTFGKSLGVRLGGTDLRAQQGGDGGYSLGGGNRLVFGANYGNAVASSGAGGVVNTTGTYINLPAVGQNGYSAASVAATIFSAAANRFLNLEISALEADGKGKVVSSPRVITANQVKALIEQGTELPYQLATASGATAVSFRKANLKLEVTPQITPEGNIILDLDVNKDSVGQATATGYAINTKHIQTQVLVENGGTVVIGGIFEMTEANSETKVPLLGDIPVVGNLFKTRSRTTNKQEMLVFITPKVINDLSLGK